MVAIRPYSDYINHRLSSAINGTIPISPTVRRVIDKHNKAQNIMTLEGVLSLEELEKKRLEEIRQLRHKRDGGSRRVQTDHGVISKGDAKLRIAGRAAFLAQEKQLHQQNIIDKINKLGEYRWGVTARAAARRTGNWQQEKEVILRRYRWWMAEMMHFHKTGSCVLMYIIDA